MREEKSVSRLADWEMRFARQQNICILVPTLYSSEDGILKILFLIMDSRGCKMPQKVGSNSRRP